MSAHHSPDVTTLLVAWAGGDRGALDQLVPIVYAELKRVARRRLAGEDPLAFDPTALVHEACVHLMQQHSVHWHNRAHFFAIAAQLMRRIVMKDARRRGTLKRGGRQPQLSLEEVDVADTKASVDLLAFNDVLTRLATFDARQATIVELRVFSGLTVEEIAALLDVSPGTVKRDWRSAKAWLHKELSPAGQP